MSLCHLSILPLPSFSAKEAEIGGDDDDDGDDGNATYIVLG